MTHTARIPFFQLAQANLHAMINLSGTVKKSSLGARLVELVNLRVSQIMAAACASTCTGATSSSRKRSRAT